MYLYKNLNIDIQQIIRHIKLFKLQNNKEINSNIVHAFNEKDKHDFANFNAKSITQYENQSNTIQKNMILVLKQF